MKVPRLWSGLIVLSVACGSKFEANGAKGDAVGSSGALGEAGDNSTITGGAAGAPAGGASSGSAAGAVGHGGSTGTGHAGAANSGGNSGSISGTGGSSLGGQAGAGVGGSVGTGGAGVAGSVGTGGAPNGGAPNGGAPNGGAPNGGSAGSAGSDCSSLQSTYLADLEKARVCNPNAIKVECSPDSTLPGACQCPVLVAANSAATAKAKLDLKAFEDAGCKAAACGVACIQYSSAVCAANGSTTTICSGAP